MPAQHDSSRLRYEFTKLKLTEDEFFRLRFMGAPGTWLEQEGEHRPEFLISLCQQPLRNVAEKVIAKGRGQLYGHSRSSTQIFSAIQDRAPKEGRPWFEKHALLCEHFKHELMEDIWIRNIYAHESNEKYSFYTEDGNHRALVYAVRVLLREESYRPISAIHATSWDFAAGILGHRPESARELKHNGKFQGPKKRAEGPRPEDNPWYFPPEDDSPTLLEVERFIRE